MSNNKKPKARILCVDDDPSILRALTWVLEKDYLISTAGNGDEALELMKTEEFDVVISDQRMPGMMGADLLYKVRQIQPRAVRILVTGYSDMEAILDSINKGEIFRYIKKPWNITDLKNTVADAVEMCNSGVQEALESTAPVAEQTPDDTMILLIDNDPNVIRLVKEISLNSSRVIHAATITQAMSALDQTDNIGVLVTDLHVEGVDVSPLLKILKSRLPELMTVVLSSRSDSQDVINLINQSLVYRFVFKPVRKGVLSLLIQSAQDKYLSLKRNPDTARLHSEATTDANLDQANWQQNSDVTSSILQTSLPSSNDTQKNLFQRFSSTLSRLFGG
jgi:DNA-binding NtrC family response regulator